MRLTRSITVAAALVAALAIVAGACGTTSGTAQSTPKPTVTVTATASSVEVATLPVHVIKKISWGIAPAPALLYPATVTVRLPSAWADKVTAYGVDGAVLLAPSGWTGSGIMCTDGGKVATLHASGDSAVAGQLNFEHRGNGPAVDSAAPYFPGARDYWAQFFGPNSGPPPTARPGLVERVVGNKLAEYHLTSGSLVDDGLQVNGVARTTVVRGSSAIPEFDRLEAALPPSDHALASAILNYYLSPSMSADSGVPATLQSYIDAINGHDYGNYVSCFTAKDLSR